VIGGLQWVVRCFVEQRVGAVMITHNRRAEALRSVGRLLALPERPPVVVVDNGSADGTADALRSRYPDVEVVASPDNLGAVGRNVGVSRLRTPYVAFCTTTPGGRR
jgi:GT2 family glycosyltransferase